MHAELIIHNGTIHTIDPFHPDAEAVAVANGRILAVGTLEEIDPLAHANTRRIDLGGRTLIPGFNDAHVHLAKVGFLLTSVLDVSAAPDIPSILAALKEQAAKTPAGTWIAARGYNQLQLAEHRHPTRYELDQVSTVHPILLTHLSDHTVVVNSRALELAGITSDTPNPPGGEIDRDEQGEPTGVLHETAVDMAKRVQPPPSAAEFEAAIMAAAKSFIRMGITSVTEAGIRPNQLKVYQHLTDDRRMPFRVNAMMLRYSHTGAKIPLPQRIETNWLRVDTVKLFADGGLSSGSAALSIPYRQSKHRVSGSQGLLRESDEKMRSLIWDIHRAGLRAAVHAVGDMAIEQVIDAINYSATRLLSRMKHRIEHFALPSLDQITRCRGRISIIPQPVFIHELGASIIDDIPAQFLSRLYPLRTLVDKGITIALSSDAPVVTNANPLLGIQAAATRLTADGRSIGPDQAISIEQALVAYTLGGALIAGEDHLKGTITPGKYADFAILSGDPLRAPAERLLDLKVEMTLVNGQVVYNG